MAGRRNVARTNKPTGKKRIVPKPRISNSTPEPEIERESCVPEPEPEPTSEIGESDAMIVSKSLTIRTFDNACKSLKLFSGQIRTHYEFDTYFIIDLHDGTRHKVFKT